MRLSDDELRALIGEPAPGAAPPRSGWVYGPSSPTLAIYVGDGILAGNAGFLFD